MNAIVPIVLYGWIPLVLGAALILPVRRVIVLAYVVGWMFLPEAKIPVADFRDLDKTTVTNLAPFLVLLVFDLRRIVGPRQRDMDPARYEWASPGNVFAAGVVLLASIVRRVATGVRWFDVPAVLWCLCPLFTSEVNDLGFYDGVSHALTNSIAWGIPYLLGRLYFSDPEGLRELALCILAGGLVYAPLCLWEIRMSPLLHDWVYGFHQHVFSQSFRGGFYRPTVFMSHGLMVGMWMSTASLMSAYARRMGRVRGVFGLPLWVETAALVVTLVLCQSWAATIFFFVGAAVRRYAAHRRRAWPIVALCCVPVFYVCTRMANMWTGGGIVSIVQRVSADRAESLGFRFESERVLVARAFEQPIFGWGGWGRGFAARDEEGEIMATADGAWILTFGTYGLVGLCSLFGILLVPVWRFVSRVRPREWRDPALAAAATLCVTLALWSIDDLANNMVNPIYILIAGGLNAIVVLRREPRDVRVPAQATAAQVAG